MSYHNVNTRISQKCLLLRLPSRHGIHRQRGPRKELIEQIPECQWRAAEDARERVATLRL
jgi:hypothetical protein